MSKKGPSEADIIFNRANVALARSQRLIQSWLPPKTDEELASAKTEEELQKEDDLLFKPIPELLGVGAAVPDDDQPGLVRRKGPASNQRLLEQLLGKKAAKGHIASSKAPERLNSSQLAAQKPDSSRSTPAEGDSDDEEESRASMVASGNTRGRNRAHVPKPKPKPAHHLPVDTPSPNTQSGAEQRSKTKESKGARSRSDSSDEEDVRPAKKRPASYLDQLLAEKASKQNKKKQKGASQG